MSGCRKADRRVTMEGKASEEWTARQRDVLDAALRLMVEEGDNLTMAGVARRASCSKETLYKWFGDRDGLLTATVQWQASKVRAGNFDRQKLDAGALRESLKRFAVNWLEVISSPTSIALNRIGVSQAAARDGNLGSIVLANGRFAIGKRMMPVLEAGREAGLLAFDDTETAFRTFFGLVGRDALQLRRAATGRPLADSYARRDDAEETHRFIPIALAPSDRAVLHARIERRFDSMLLAGFVDEVIRLRRHYQLDPNLPSMRCVGYRQALEFLDGQCDMRTFRDKGVFATRQLAKRQITWQRNFRENWGDLTEVDCLVADVEAQVWEIVARGLG